MASTPANLFELYQSGIASALSVMKTCLQGAEQLRTQQLSAIRNSMSELARSSDEVAGAESFEQLFALQSQIAGWQFEKVLGHWGGFCQSGAESQAEVLKQVYGQLVQVRDRFRDTLKAATGGSEPLMNAVQSMLSTTSTAYALSTRATEQASRFCAQHAKIAEAALRYEAEKSARGRGERPTA